MKQNMFDVVGEILYVFTEYENVKESFRTVKNYAKIKLIVRILFLFKIIILKKRTMMMCQECQCTVFCLRDLES